MLKFYANFADNETFKLTRSKTHLKTKSDKKHTFQFSVNLRHALIGKPMDTFASYWTNFI